MPTQSIRRDSLLSLSFRNRFANRSTFPSLSKSLPFLWINVEHQYLFPCSTNWSNKVETHAALRQAGPSDYIWHFVRLFHGQFSFVGDSVDWAVRVGFAGHLYISRLSPKPNCGGQLRVFTPPLDGLYQITKQPYWLWWIKGRKLESCCAKENKLPYSYRKSMVHK